MVSAWMVMEIGLRQCSQVWFAHVGLLLTGNDRTKFCRVGVFMRPVVRQQEVCSARFTCLKRNDLVNWTCTATAQVGAV